MNYLKIALFFIAGFLTLESNAQTKAENPLPENSFTIQLDSLEIEIYNNYESDNPPLDVNKLRKPTLFILNNEELEISEFSELKIKEEKIESVSIIQKPEELKEMGYNSFNSVVKIRTEIGK